MPARLSFDRVAAIYDESRALPPKVLARLLNVLVEEFQGKRVLEVGVGTGRYAVPLQKSGLDVVGVDISHKMVELGIAKGLRNVLFADGARLPFTPRGFDVATTNHMLHLVPDWREVLLEMARVTRESYFTIIEKSEGAVSLQREYERLAKEEGFEWQPPGIHERDLPNLLKPDVVLPVGPFQEHVLSNAVLADIEARSYTRQWYVPEEIHRKVMVALRKEWTDRDLARTVTLEVTFWRAERLPEIVKAFPQMS